MDFTKLVTAFISDPSTALLVILILGGIVAISSGKFLVPKSIYDHEVVRADRLAETIQSMISAQRDVTEALKDLTTEVLRR
jgi:hypothetical protein